jgi:hypothetical protein
MLQMPSIYFHRCRVIYLFVAFHHGIMRIASHFIRLFFIKLHPFVVPGSSVVFTDRFETQPHLHAPAAPPKYYFINGKNVLGMG